MESWLARQSAKWVVAGALAITPPSAAGLNLTVAQPTAVLHQTARPTNQTDWAYVVELVAALDAVAQRLVWIFSKVRPPKDKRQSGDIQDPSSDSESQDAKPEINSAHWCRWMATALKIVLLIGSFVLWLKRICRRR
jgi:hypothetical protein